MGDLLSEFLRIEALAPDAARERARALATEASASGDELTTALALALAAVGPDPQLAERLRAAVDQIDAGDWRLWNFAGDLAGDLMASDADRARMLIGFAESSTHVPDRARITEIIRIARQSAIRPSESIRVDLLEYDARFGEPLAPRFGLLAQLRTARAQHSEEPELAARVAARCALDAWWHQDSELAAATHELLLQDASAPGSARAHLLQQFALGACAVLLGLEADAQLRSMREATAAHPDTELQLFALAAAVLLNQPVSAAELAGAGGAGSGQQLDFIRLSLAVAAAWRGEPPTAAEVPSTTSTLAALAHAVDAVRAANRGDHERCRESSAAGIEAGIRDQHRWAASLSLAAYGRLELGAGSPDAALTILLRIADPMDALGHPVTARLTAADLAEAALRTGRVDVAQAEITRLEAQADQGCRHSLAVLTRFRAMTAEPSEAEHRFATAVTTATGSGFEEARTRLVHGEYLRRTRRRVRARTELQLALSLFERSGALPWAERARRELEATAQTARRGDPDAPHLTQRERQIAELVSAGASNQETADRLIMSRKTVEHHLRNIYARLGISSREDIADALRQG